MLATHSDDCEGIPAVRLWSEPERRVVIRHRRSSCRFYAVSYPVIHVLRGSHIGDPHAMATGSVRLFPVVGVSLDVRVFGGVHRVRRAERQLRLPRDHYLRHRELRLGLDAARRFLLVRQVHAQHRAPGVGLDEELELLGGGEY